MGDITHENIAIVGGGITGLFCAYMLQKQGCKNVHVFEASDRLGGRIRTVRLGKDSAILGENWDPKELEFYAEFGPMRIELDKQLLLKALLTDLEITDKNDGSGAYLKAFPAYSSPSSQRDPQYQLRADELNKTPLQLLRLALLRIIVHLKIEGQSEFNKKQDELINDIKLAAATQEQVEPIFLKWMKGSLDDNDYWDIQTKGKVNGEFIYNIGFWNLVSDYLSHDAITKLRDLGSFYHLLPENPNAAEWLVWWLIGFAISEHLQGIFGGMECIIEKLRQKLDGVHINLNSRVVALHRRDDSLKVEISSEVDGQESRDIREISYNRVIFTLPQWAMTRVVQESREVFEQANETKIDDLLDSVFGFPMVKLFMVVRNRWWQQDERPNWYATRIPTRELHWWKGMTSGSKQGLIMAYTDRPASSFWADYVQPGPQTDVTQTGDHGKFEKRLKDKFMQYINENDLPEILDADIPWCGIRDWGRPPYGGANHAWRPGRRYWAIMRRLADIVVRRSSTPRGEKHRPLNIHICGEAYSDYHGFMEGSLRSAVYTLHRILDRNGAGDNINKYIPWLTTEKDKNQNGKLVVDEKYLKNLKEWVKKLDDLTAEKERKIMDDPEVENH